VLYWTLKVLLTPVLAGLYRIRVEGRRNVPRAGPAILAGNHLSALDWIFVPFAVRRRVTYVAKAEYFDDWRTAWFFSACGQIPMRREGGTASERALEAARGVLQSGRLLGIFPEGTRSPDGRLYKGHTGVARLALDCGVPVVPVAVTGTDLALPPGRMAPRVRVPITVRFGAPMTIHHHAARAHEPLALRAFTDEIMFELAQMSGQEYVDRYAVRGASLVGSEPPARLAGRAPVPAG
jgi:1-acyl-sn-glycerol-3-phosphate acyltransferase